MLKSPKMQSYNLVVILIFVYITNCVTQNSTFNNSRPRVLIRHSDEYVVRNQKQCFESRSLVSCIKYKASKIIWKLAANGVGYFPKEYGRELVEDKRRIRLIQLGQPSEISVFSDARSLDDDSELTAILKFVKRAAQVFGQNHGIQVTVSSDSGARIIPADLESRGIIAKKKRKWMILLPLIILMKIAHLKMTVVALLFGVLGLNVLLVGGIGWLIHYLKFKTLCKIHPQLVQHHSHVYDSDPADDSELTAILKFVKRAAQVFGQNHGIQVTVSSDSGARIIPADLESRGIIAKKKRKWMILLPLIILMKIAHLKMTVVALLFGVLGLNVLLVGGIGWLIHYLKFKTLCKIHPQLVQHHSHVYDSDPADYSQFVGSSFPGSYYSSSGGSPHEVGSNYISKDWSTSKAYHGHNYLDTISKRLQ